ncbi:MAG: sigma-70 family RNA polymerase sigma factor [Bacteroidales bacterium]|nr:sigma-70 family RNA polymerase sigma factor [Bacteroidales bacterium]
MNTAQEITDKKLVEQFVEGDSSSFEELIKRYKDRVFTYILMIVKNQDLANDIFQDTFIKVMSSLRKSKYEDRGSLISWIIRISHNLIIDHFRKEKRLQTVSNDDSEIDLFNSAKFSDSNIEEILVKQQIENDVRKLLDTLPNEQKQVVLLRLYGDMSFKEISELTGVSINTALGRMRYALINLRKVIEDNKINLIV